MEKMVRVGGIGTGNVFNGGHLPAYAALSNIEVVALYDIDKEAAEKTRDTYMQLMREGGRNVDEQSHIVVCKSPQELLERVDLVDVCTPVRFHGYYADLCLAAGVNVMTEKPMARTWWEARHVAETAQSSKAYFQLNDDNLFIPRYLCLRNIIEGGMIGDVQNIWISRGTSSSERKAWFWEPLEAGGGAVMDYGSHAVASSWFLLGYDLVPMEVRSMGIRVKDRTRLVDGRLIRIHIDDDAHFKVRFRDRKTGDWVNAYIESTWSWPELGSDGSDVHGYIEIEGSLGTATACFEEEKDFIRVRHRVFGEKRIPVKTVLSERESFEGEIRNMARSIACRIPPMLSADIGASVISILNCAQLSELRGRTTISPSDLEEFSKKLARGTSDPWQAADKIVLELAAPYVDS
jgi:predicted dehydrogenase